MDSLAFSTSGTVKRFAWADLNQETWLPDGALTALQAVEYKSEIWTGWDGPRLVAVFGYTQIFPHLAEVWSYLHPQATQYPVTMCRTALRMLHKLQRYRRVQAAALDNQSSHGQWLEWLGFSVESIMPLSGPRGETMRRYVWFPQGGAEHGRS
jgi:hypothetical protein